MADKRAQTLTQPSNRARPKKNGETKVVFKPVLDSPFRIQWPSVPVNLQNRMLAHILQLLTGASEYQQHRFSENRKRKRAASSAESSKQAKRKSTSDAMATTTTAEESANASTALAIASSVEDRIIEAPPILEHLVCGINAVTKRLEEQTHAARRPVIATIPESESKPSTRPLHYLFVCRADVDPPMLIDHLPHLVAAFNSTRPELPVKLAPLPKGSEESLAEALGIRRVAVIGIDVVPSDDPAFRDLMDQVPVLAAPWLTQVGAPQQIIPTHIKQIRTTAPRDMKLAKETRAAGRSKAKDRARHKKKKDE